jgi:hypothetical protein
VIIPVPWGDLLASAALAALAFLGYVLRTLLMAVACHQKPPEEEDDNDQDPR